MKVPKLLSGRRVCASVLLVHLLCQNFALAQTVVEPPDAEQVVKITIDETSTAAFFTPASLKGSLSRLRVSKQQVIQVDVVGVALQQSGSIILRNRSVIKWLAPFADKILFSDGKTGEGTLYDVTLDLGRADPSGADSQGGPSDRGSPSITAPWFSFRPPVLLNGSSLALVFVRPLVHGSHYPDFARIEDELSPQTPFALFYSDGSRPFFDPWSWSTTYFFEMKLAGNPVNRELLDLQPK